MITGKSSSVRLIGAAAFACGVALCAPAARADHAAHSPAAAVTEALRGATVEGETVAGRTYRIVYGTGGRMTMTVDGMSETGNWSVDPGGHYCETWPKAFAGAKRCSGIEISGGLLILRGPFNTTRTLVSSVPGK